MERKNHEILKMIKNLRKFHAFPKHFGYEKSSHIWKNGNRNKKVKNKKQKQKEETRKRE